MKICHVISSIDKKAGGTATYIQGLSKALLNQNLQITISTLLSKNPLIFENQVMLDYNSNIKKILKKKINFDVFHINGLWELFLHRKAVLAHLNKIPYIISPHGMLEKWSLNQGRLKKKIALLLYQKSDLANATCIHVTAYSEMERVRELGLKNPIALIPNGIDVTDFPHEECNTVSNKKTLLFLSRIHPKKGIEFLIDAWGSIDHLKKLDWQIKIIGNGDERYISKLKQKVKDKNLSKEILILPPIFDVHKKIEALKNVKYTNYEVLIIGDGDLNENLMDTIKNHPIKEIVHFLGKLPKEQVLKYLKISDIFVFPSREDIWGLVLNEAIAYGLPLISTKQVGASYSLIEIGKNGYIINIDDVDELAKAIDNLLAKDLTIMREHSLKIAQKYTIENMVIDHINLFSKINLDREGM